MKACPHYEPFIAGLLFEELTAGERERLEAHLAGCAACRSAVREMEATLRITAGRARPEPPPAFWDGYYDRLAARLAEEEHRRAPEARLAAWRQTVLSGLDGLSAGRRWAVQLAAAAGLVAAGVFVGWLVFGTEGVEAPSVAEAPVEVPVLQAALDARTDRYLARSKVLLLGLVNAEPGQDGAALGLARKRAVARELVAEADTLKTALKPRDQRALRALIDDLEVILLQIANLEAAHDFAAVEMVQRGVDSRALLLKIDMTALRRAGPPPAPADPPTF